MSLTARVSAFLLVVLAVVLAGFSGGLYLLARTYLYGQADERLEAGLDTLAAAAEVQDGLSVLKRYRADGGAAPVLFLTARDAVSDRVRGLDGGADDYLCKPFAFDELLARVRALARRPARGGGTVLRYQDLSVDLATQRTERAGHRLDLTAKEQALRVLFLRHPGEVLSRTRIYEQVWDERYDGLSNTLEVHVMELRRKLEAHGPRLIHTVRGRGYVLGDRDDSWNLRGRTNP